MDLYFVRGEKCEEVLSDASVLFLVEGLLFVGSLPEGGGAPCEVRPFISGRGGPQEAVEIRYACVERFRQHKPDMCQWSVDTGGGKTRIGHSGQGGIETEETEGEAEDAIDGDGEIARRSWR